jgi:hypothetical protein
VANFLLCKRIDLDRRTKSEGYLSKSAISCKLPLVASLLLQKFQRERFGARFHKHSLSCAGMMS